MSHRRWNNLLLRRNPRGVSEPVNGPPTQRIITDPGELKDSLSLSRLVELEARQVTPQLQSLCPKHTNTRTPCTHSSTSARPFHLSRKDALHRRQVGKWPWGPEYKWQALLIVSDDNKTCGIGLESHPSTTCSSRLTFSYFNLLVCGLLTPNTALPEPRCSPSFRGVDE